MANAIASWTSSFPNDNNIVQQALLALSKFTLLEKDARTFGLPSSPTRKERKENKKFKKYVAGTIVDIPDRSAKTDDEVAEFINQTCLHIGDAFKTIVATEMFHEVLEEAYNSERMWKGCVDPDSGQSLFEYMDTTVVEAEPVVNYKNILVDFDVKRIERNLFDKIEAEEDEDFGEQDGEQEEEEQEEEEDVEPTNIWDKPKGHQETADEIMDRKKAATTLNKNKDNNDSNAPSATQKKPEANRKIAATVANCNLTN